MDEYLKIFWLDTSALAKIFLDEPGSHELRIEFNGQPGHFFYTTDYCKYELFNVLKRKLLHERSIDLESYFRHIFILNTYVKTGQLKIDDTEDKTTTIWTETILLAEKYNFDYTDAIQFILIKRGFLNIFRGGESEAVLVTSDKNMKKAANGENMKNWDPEKGPL